VAFVCPRHGNDLPGCAHGSGFAAHSASAGSLYAYATEVFAGPFGQAAAWGLLFAYIGTASATLGGFANYSVVLWRSQFAASISPIWFVALGAIAATWTAYRDVEVSARLMLWFEAISVTLITFVVAAALWRNGLHVDHAQLHLEGASPAGIRLGVILAIFSFVGFESATALGVEAKDPRRNIPRAVMLSAVVAGCFFAFCAYGEVFGFRNAHQDLSQSGAPLEVLTRHAGFAALSPLINACAALSFLACVISCITAAARIALLMAHRGLLPRRLRSVHSHNRTPSTAVLAAGTLAAWPPALLFARGVNAIDVNGLMGSLAVYGFVTAYLVVAIALPVHLRATGERSLRATIISAIVVAALLAALAGSFYPLPPAPYSYLGLIFTVYLLAGLFWSMRQMRGT
jgi:amino acid transporter